MREKRRYPRFFIDLPLEYRESDASHKRGGIAVNASEGGILVESTKDIPVGTQLAVDILYPKWFELAGLKLVGKIIWKEPLFKEEWEGYQYGLSMVQILDEDHRKLKQILNGRFNLETIDTCSDLNQDIEMPPDDRVKTSRYNVLVADDEEGVRKLLVTVLSQRGHRCLQAMDGVEALDKTMKNGLDAIVTDMVMPKMGGITLIKEMLRVAPKIPIMAMTGYDHEFSSVKAITAGAREFIHKPFSLTEFGTRFDKMMDERKISIESEAK